MTTVLVLSDESRMRSLARELAMGIREVNEILADAKITDDEWQRWSSNPRFSQLLQQETSVWNSALNTRERVDLKTLAMVEEALPEMFAVLHDKKEPLSARVELFKALQKGAGIGARVDSAGATSDRVNITINMGADKQVSVTQQVSPLIEGEVVDG